jgi:hypothetical protein
VEALRQRSGTDADRGDVLDDLQDRLDLVDRDAERCRDGFDVLGQEATLVDRVDDVLDNAVFPLLQQRAGVGQDHLVRVDTGGNDGEGIEIVVAVGGDARDAGLAFVTAIQRRRCAVAIGAAGGAPGALQRGAAGGAGRALLDLEGRVGQKLLFDDRLQLLLREAEDVVRFDQARRHPLPHVLGIVESLFHGSLASRHRSERPKVRYLTATWEAERRKMKPGRPSR